MPSSTCSTPSPELQFHQHSAFNSPQNRFPSETKPATTPVPGDPPLTVIERHDMIYLPFDTLRLEATLASLLEVWSKTTVDQTQMGHHPGDISESSIFTSGSDAPEPSASQVSFSRISLMLDNLMRSPAFESRVIMEVLLKRITTCLSELDKLQQALQALDNWEYASQCDLQSTANLLRQSRTAQYHLQDLETRILAALRSPVTADFDRYSFSKSRKFLEKELVEYMPEELVELMSATRPNHT